MVVVVVMVVVVIVDYHDDDDEYVYSLLIDYDYDNFLTLPSPPAVYP